MLCGASLHRLVGCATVVNALTWKADMAFDNTITENDLDQDGLAFVEGLRNRQGDPDLDVDGMSDSILARILRLFRLA